MNNKWIVPSAEQSEQALIVQMDLVEVVNNSIRDGIDARVVLAALASTIADTVTSVFGNTAVVPWYEMQASIARKLLGGVH